MPFPVIDRQRYFQYAFGIGSLLVIFSLKKSSSIHTTTTFSPPTSDTELSEIISHSSLQPFSDLLTENTNSKFLKLTCSMNIVGSDHKNSSSKTSTCSNMKVFNILNEDFKKFIWWQEDLRDTLKKVYRQANNHHASDFKDSELILQDFINRYVDPNSQSPMKPYTIDNLLWLWLFRKYIHSISFIKVLFISHMNLFIWFNLTIWIGYFLW